MPRKNQIPKANLNFTNSSKYPSNKLSYKEMASMKMPTIKVLKLKGRTLFCYLGYRKIYKICWLFSDGNLCMCLYSVGSGNTENPMYTYRLFCFVIKQFSCKGYFHQLIKIYLLNIILLYKIFPIHFSVCFFGYPRCTGLMLWKRK